MKTISVKYDCWQEIQQVRIKSNLRSMEDALNLLLNVYKGDDFKREMSLDEAVKNLAEVYARKGD